MTTPLAFSFIFTLLALVFTLSVLLMWLFWRNWKTREGWALFRFLASLVILQSGIVLIHTGLLSELDDSIIKGFLNLALIGFGLVTLTTLTSLLHAGGALKEAWDILLRTGIAALIVLQPALWQHDFLALSHPLDHDLMGSSYTHLGQVLAVISGGYLGLTLLAAWRYRKRINNPLFTGSITGIVLAQLATLASGYLREMALAAIAGGVISIILGYQMIREFRITPSERQAVWLQAWNNILKALTGSQPLNATLASIAQQARLLLRSDIVSVLLVTDPHQLKIVAMAGPGPSIVGRQIQSGEGLAGRVMQTMQPMRVDDYQGWDGRAASFEDIALYASMSVPLVYRSKIIGVLNANQTRPGRIFTERDQALLELLAPQAAIAIAQAHTEEALHTTQTHLKTILSDHADAMMIFDSEGVLQAANSAARNYLQLLFDNSVPGAVRLEDLTPDPTLAAALNDWTASQLSAQTLEIEHPKIGKLRVQLQALGSEKPCLLVTIHPLAGEFTSL